LKQFLELKENNVNLNERLKKSEKENADLDRRLEKSEEMNADLNQRLKKTEDYLTETKEKNADLKKTVDGMIFRYG